MIEPIAFDAATPRFGMPFLVAGQAQKEFFVNESLALLDMLVHPVVQGMATIPPDAPVSGECWIIADNAEGDWDGKSGSIAGWDGSQWTFIAPQDGFHAYDRERASFVTYRNGWQAPVPISAPSGGSTVDSECRVAIADLIAALKQRGLII